ncbi:hypothetical protein K2W90_01080 [Candidatus Babeliales bacterium]|nr:hypothetical protein [Candidatus Babeliales bacterium]
MNHSTITPFSFALILAFSCISSAQAWRVAGIENEMATEITIELVLNEQSIFTQTIPAQSSLNAGTFVAPSSLPTVAISHDTIPSSEPAPLSPYHSTSSSTESFEDYYPVATLSWPFYFPSFPTEQELTFPELPTSYLLITTPLGKIYCVEGYQKKTCPMPASWQYIISSNPRKPASIKVLHYSKGLSGGGGTPDRPCIISIGKNGLLSVKSYD